jgi:hypothetical protein
VFYKSLRQPGCQPEQLGKVVGMTRGNQRDLAREKNLKKQQVLAHALPMIGVV